MISEGRRDCTLMSESPIIMKVNVCLSSSSALATFAVGV